MPFLCREVTLLDRNGEQDTIELFVHFNARCTSRGCAASWDGPAEGAEFDLQFSGAEIDPQYREFFPPLSAAHVASCRRWFDRTRQQDAAYQAACDDGCDDPDYGRDWDAVRERRLDDAMERGEPRRWAA